MGYSYFKVNNKYQNPNKLVEDNPQKYFYNFKNFVLRGKEEEVDIFPEQDNLELDLNLKLEKTFEFDATFNALENNINQLCYSISNLNIDFNLEGPENLKHYIIKENNLEERQQTTDKLYIKILDQSYLGDDSNCPDEVYLIKEKLNKRVYKETLINLKLKHKFIPDILGYTLEDSNKRIYIIYEEFEIKLRDLIIDNALSTFVNKLRLFKNLIEIILYLHSNGITSMELSPDTIGITKKENCLKLLSFGNSIKFGESSDIFYQSLFDRLNFNIFTAPEIYLNKRIITKYLWSADIWSLGVLASVIFQDNTSNYAYILRDFEKLERNIYTDEGRFNELLIYNVFHLGTIENIHLKALILSMINTDPLIRPNIFTIIENFNSIIHIYNLDDEYKIHPTSSLIDGFIAYFDDFTNKFYKDNCNISDFNINNNEVKHNSKLDVDK